MVQTFRQAAEFISRNAPLELARPLLAMPTVAPLAQQSRLVFGLLSLTANQTKELTEATFSRVSAAPGSCRGITIQVRSGSVKLVDKSDATDGWTLTAGVPFGDDSAADLAGWYLKETAGSTATVEVICRTGGVS